jgi:predicted GTPase
MVKQTEKGFLSSALPEETFTISTSSFRSRPHYEVVGFTAAQIPEISCRLYPPELSGELYPDDLPIWPEDSLEEIIKSYTVDRCIMAYSDLSNQAVMDLASRVLAIGADFGFLGGWHTMLESKKPVVAVCAVRTGSGKARQSGTSRTRFGRRN